MSGSTRPGDSREFSNVDSSFISPLLLHGDYNRDPNIKALQTSGFINHGSALGRFMEVSIRLWPRGQIENSAGLCCLGRLASMGFGFGHFRSELEVLAIAWATCCEYPSDPILVKP